MKVGAGAQELERWSELRQRLAGHFGSGVVPSVRDRREHLRLPTHLRVVFAGGDALRTAWLENISEGGIFVATSRPLDVDTPLWLAIAAEPRPVLEIAGRVAWVRGPRAPGGPGMGVRFEEVSRDQHRRLEALLAGVVRPRTLPGDGRAALARIARPRSRICTPSSCDLVRNAG